MGLTRFSWDGWWLGVAFATFGLVSLIVVLESGSPLASLGAGLSFITGLLLVWAVAADELRLKDKRMMAEAHMEALRMRDEEKIEEREKAAREAAKQLSEQASNPPEGTS